MIPKLNSSRGEFLMWFGVIYLALGLTYALDPGETVIHSMAWMPEWSSVRVCGLAWIVSGALAIVFAFKPIPLDRFGFMALSMWSAAWSIAWVFSQVKGYNDRGYISALIFMLLARVVMIVAAMLNPPKVKR